MNEQTSHIAQTRLGLTMLRYIAPSSPTGLKYSSSSSPQLGLVPGCTVTGAAVGSMPGILLSGCTHGRAVRTRQLVLGQARRVFHCFVMTIGTLCGVPRPLFPPAIVVYPESEKDWKLFLIEGVSCCGCVLIIFLTSFRFSVKLSGCARKCLPRMYMWLL
jgi:hypothetical protein